MKKDLKDDEEEYFYWEVQTKNGSNYEIFDYGYYSEYNEIKLTENDLIKIVGKQEGYVIRCRPVDNGSWIDRTSKSTTISFSNFLPTVINFEVTQPSCAGGDGLIQITGLKDVFGNNYVFPEFLNTTVQEMNNEITGVPFTIDGLVDRDKKDTFYIEAPKRDEFVCKTKKVIEIENPASYSHSIHFYETRVKTRPICAGGKTGEMYVGINYHRDDLFVDFALVDKNDINNVIEKRVYGRYAVISGVPEGFYYVRAVICEDTVQSLGTYEIKSLNEPIDFDVTVTDASCRSRNDGSVTVTNITGGIGNYTYWKSGWQSVVGGTFTFGNLGIGTKYVYVEDGNKCRTLKTVPLGYPEKLEIENLVEDPILCSGGTGSITVTTTNGASPFTYRLLKGGVLQQTITNNLNTAVFNNVPEGDYFVEVLGCGGDKPTETISLSDPTSTIHFSSKEPEDESCIGANDGKVTIQIAGGFIPRDYEVIVDGSLIKGTKNITTYDFDNLSAGTHTVTIRDKNRGCTATETFDIGSPPVLSISSLSISQDIVCDGGTGSLSMTVLDGVAPFSYKIIGESGGVIREESLASGDMSPDLTGLPADTYIIEIADHCGELESNAIELKNTVTQLRLDLSLDGITCTGEGDGQINAEITEGQSPYSIKINEGSFEQVTGSSYQFSNIDTNLHTVEVRDANNCTLAKDIDVTEPDVLMINSVEVTDATCSTSNNGEVLFVANGGTAPYRVQHNTLLPITITGTVGHIGALQDTIHTITLIDTNGCSAQTEITVGVSPVINAEVDEKVDVSCYGLADGHVFVKTTGGRSGATYEYSKNDELYAINGLFTSLKATTYQIVVRDANAISCTDTITVEITEPPLLTIDKLEETTSVICYGQDDASIDVETNGGPSAHEYLLLEGSDTIASANDVDAFTFNGISAGDYTLIVNAGECSEEGTIEIGQPDELLIGATTTDYNGVFTTCHDANDGLITLTSRGGTYPHRYTSTTLESQSLTEPNTEIYYDSLVGGVYSFTLTDAQGCVADSIFTLLPADTLKTVSELPLFENGLSISCFGISDGQIKTKVSGGVAPYTISLNEADALETSDSLLFDELSAGEYSYEVIDKNACTVSDYVVFEQPDVLQIQQIELSQIGNHNLACYGDSVGTATLKYTGGSAPFNVLLNGVTNQNHNVSDRELNIEALQESSYAVTITDLQGCTVDSIFEITAPTPLYLDANKTSVVRPECGGDQTGLIHVEAIGGVTDLDDYKYSLFYENAPSDLPFDTEQLHKGEVATFDSLIGGFYTVTVEDSNACTYQEVIQVNSNKTLALTISGSSLMCKFDTNGYGEIAVREGGTGPYDVYVTSSSPVNTISENLGVTKETIVRLDDLPEDKYNVKIVDSSGCSYEPEGSFFNVLAPDEKLSLQASVQNVSCYQKADGEVTLTATGGWNNQPYTFGIDTNALVSEDSIFSLLSDGNHVFYVKDSNNCVVKTELEVTQPDLLVTTIDAHTDVLCNSDATGDFMFSTEGGTTPYYYSIDSGNTFTTMALFDHLIADDYKLMTKDSLGCVSLNEITLDEPTKIVSTLLSKENTQCEQSTGSASANVVGGITPYAHKWVDGNGVQLSSALQLDNISAGRYHLVTEDNHNCFDTLMVSIVDTNEMIVDVEVLKQASCYDTADGTAALRITEIVAPYTVMWHDASVLDTLSDVLAGSHSVLVTDGNNCKKVFEFTVTEPDSIAISFHLKQPICNGECTGAIAADVIGGTGDYLYAWSTGGTDTIIENVCKGEYALQVTDEHGCVMKELVNLAEPKQPVLYLADSTYVVCDGQIASVDLSAYANHKWNYPDGSVNNNSAIVTNEIGYYNVSVTDADNCTLTATFEVAQSSRVFNAEILIPGETFVGDTVVTVNLTQPNPDQVTWLFDTTYIKQLSSGGVYQELVFEEEGAYELGIQSQLGECYSQQTKTILVFAAEDKPEDEDLLGYQETGIKKVVIYPNPNDGEFNCSVLLNEELDIKLYVVDQQGNNLVVVEEFDVEETILNVNLENPQTGSYILIIETADDMKTKHFIVR